MALNRKGVGESGSTVTALIANPTAVHLETGSEHWAVLGTRPERIVDYLAAETSFADVVDRAKSLPGEYSLIRYDSTRDVKAYRGIASSFNVYYCRRPRDGALVVGDHFKNVLSQLPVSHRTVPPSVPIDQLLFGTRPTDTYVEEVGRLGHGEVLEWTRTGEPETELVEALSVDETIDGTEAKRRLDRHFTDRLGDAKFDGSVATMLSGGVDSTLIHTYLGNEATVSAAFDAPEFEFEIDYARRASDLLDSAHEILQFDEEQFLEHVEATIDAAGQPLLLPQATLMHLAVSRSPHQIYFNGGLADGLFGTGTAALAYLAQYAGRASRLLPKLTWQIEALQKTSEQLRRPASDPAGCAMNFRIHSDQNLVANMFGDDAVEARKNRRLRYTMRRVDADDREGYAAHMHLGHAIEYFHDNILTIWRHAAHDSGKAIQTPFAGRKVFETALAIPPADRYARFAVPPREQPTQVVQYKYLLKELLEERLPAYDTKKRKGHSLLPMQRFLDDGPLSNAFDEYSIPEFVPKHHRDDIREGTDEVTWYALNYAIWRDRILLNEDLDLVETTTVLDS